MQKRFLVPSGALGLTMQTPALLAQDTALARPLAELADLGSMHQMAQSIVAKRAAIAIGLASQAEPCRLT